MSTAAEHPTVTAYLREFDAASGSLTATRREELREEIASHLREAIPPLSSQADATAVIAAFGSPAEIVGQEGTLDQSASSVAPADESRRGLRIALGAIVIAAAAISAVFFLWPGNPANTGAGSGTTQPDAAPSSVVNEVPEGPARVAEGTAYFEYLAAIETMPEPLPSGAAYPTGVPEGLDLGATDDGIQQSGAGATVAHFTWLCAWEAEYLTAADDEDAERQVAAEAMLTQWPSYGFVSDPDGGWAANVLEPLSFGDTAGLQKDFPQTCAQAGILNVTAP
ncbi:hypothetical protein CLV85_0507 [Salinibacterium amurskyense]|uniref:Uncharacterized protein n=1 Tax=Salinibacterium amurskyense TaxID=205941 RepID=A0A2M9D6K1_9MICO|nr:hypothetical protein [Salinibacterium amurskyense]PJJ81335.1 hypothetical protein CLV85_0507 [Salinibacterium amurskyense]RLQ83341.1 hypothetical protein D9C83_02515 [Salinibacterium amurskyense]GHD80862.1 hypothetical protein GCM10007394_13020 [Salinibacterium amurskyense]